MRAFEFNRTSLDHRHGRFHDPLRLVVGPGLLYVDEGERCRFFFEGGVREFVDAVGELFRGGVYVGAEGIGC
jgi:hypothetical protein